MQYTCVNVCCGAEQKLFNNVTCNHVRPLSHISQLHPFDAPCWTALPNYGTDAHVIQVNAMTGPACSLRVLIVAQPHAFIRSPNGSYTGNFHTPGRHLTASLPTAYFLGRVVSLTADAHPLARGNLRPISVDLLQPHPH
ncbi:hypothetical protein O181_121356 [Austropuccinia psidii MF-1]|uniref:Uncharacterized protein n=1 Tax=Austropuccinia psidii MF-1 TaxID=1389203 RepID=A0A9Q3KJH1_9BASI|nr:hypothetical protein [Austropuccinia psidii MF-1]